jgi:hypothetical protein
MHERNTESRLRAPVQSTDATGSTSLGVAAHGRRNTRQVFPAADVDFRNSRSSFRRVDKTEPQKDCER